MANVTLERRQRRGWILYDFANSTYHLMLPSILGPLYFREYLLTGVRMPDLVWALVVSLPVVLAGLIAPFVGAIADFGKCRLRLLVATACGTVAIIAIFPLIPKAAWPLAAMAFGLSYLCFTVSLGLYDGLLTVVASKQERGRLSGLAWGIGYLGGIVAVALTLPLLQHATLPADASNFRDSVWLVAVLFALFAVVSFVMLRGVHEPSAPDSVSSPAGGKAQRFRDAAWHVVSTLRHWRRNRGMFTVMASYYLANDGLSTLVYFTSIYASTTLGFSNRQILSLFLIAQLVGVPASIVAGVLADKFSHKKVLFGCLTIWVMLTIAFAVGKGISVFYVLSIGTGLVIGSTPAVYRSLLAGFVPEKSTGEMFGFNSLASRASAVAGPILFGLVSSWTGSQRIAMISVLVFFVLALLVLRCVPSDGKAAPLAVEVPERCP